MEDKRTVSSIIDQLSAEQKVFFESFYYTNFIKNLNCIEQRISRDDILNIENMTRGQSENNLWNLLRLDRQTASNSGVSCRIIPTTAAMTYGHTQEKELKTGTALINQLKSTIEKELNTSIIDTVLEAGMFISPIGLHSASPDAYFVTLENMFIPVEIKCPYMYRDVDDVQKILKQNKPRYRVKGTAFSLNHNGPPVFAVEKSDPHYRQMQRQMYVMQAPICLYVVKFGNTTVTHVVHRDDAFCRQEQETETKILKMIVMKNKQKNLYKIEARRLDTFKNLETFTGEEKNMLASKGVYNDFGTLKCAFCDVVLDCDSPAEVIAQMHDTCATSKDNEPEINVMFPCYFVNNARACTLPAQFQYLSDQGLFYDRSSAAYKTFCCGLTLTSIADSKIKHRHNCEFDKFYLQKQ